MIRVELPGHLRTMVGAPGEIELDLPAPVSPQAIVAALEDRYPQLRGTIREYGSGKRRPFLRFFACGEDLSHQPIDTPLPEAVASGAEPFLIVGAIAGG